MPVRFLKPGEIVLTARPATITTVLGSCVSVTLHDPRSRLSAICHAMLPDSTAAARSQRYPDSYYVDAAVKRMLAEFEKRGLACARLEVALVGGATSSGGRFAVGQGNVVSALKTLAQEGLKPATLDVGGQLGRKLSFDTATGQVHSISLRQLDQYGSTPCSKS